MDMVELEKDNNERRVLEIKLIEQKIISLESLICSKLEGTATALSVKNAEMERRLEALNELRGEVLKDRVMFLRNDVYEAKHSELTNILNNIINRITIIETDKIAIDSKLVLLNKLQTEVAADRDQFIKSDIYMIKTASYDNFVSDTRDRITVIETRNITWTASIALFVIIMNFVMFFIERFYK